MDYKFKPGDRVRLVSNWRLVGTVETTVPGNGSIEWYFVRWDTDQGIGLTRYTRDELETE